MRKLNALVIMKFRRWFFFDGRAQSTPGVNNAELKGDYAFTFKG